MVGTLAKLESFMKKKFKERQIILKDKLKFKKELQAATIKARQQEFLKQAIKSSEAAGREAAKKKFGPVTQLEFKKRKELKKKQEDEFDKLFRSI